MDILGVLTILIYLVVPKHEGINGKSVALFRHARISEKEARIFVRKFLSSNRELQACKSRMKAQWQVEPVEIELDEVLSAK